MKLRYHLSLIYNQIIKDPLNKGSRTKLTLDYIRWQFFHKYKSKEWTLLFENGYKSIVKPFPDHDAGELNIWTKNVDYYDNQFIRSILDKGDNIVDAGCNVGNRTWVIADKIGGALLIDAGKAAIQRTKENLRLNNLSTKDFVIVNKAVGCKEGRIFFSDLGGASTINKVVDENDAIPKYGIEITTIDNEVKEWGRTVSFIKIDVEGQDYNALLGAEETLKQPSMKLIKFEHNPTEPLMPIIHFLEKFKYEVFALNQNGKISFDKQLISTNMNLFASPASYLKSLDKNYFDLSNKSL